MSERDEATRGHAWALAPIRVGEDDDFSARLWNYWRDLGAEPSPVWHARYLARLAADAGRGRHPLWGLRGEERFGFVVLRLDADWLLPERRIGYVAEFCVFPPWRRRGCGRRLFELSRRWLADRGSTGVELDVLPDNRVALAFWQRLGFTLAYHHLRRP